MKTAGKVTVGVVLLGLVVGSVIKGPAWKQRLRIWHYEKILLQLTPEQAIALCGKPVVDETDAREGELTRKLILRNYYALAVELDFSASAAEPKNWRLIAVQDPSGEVKYEGPASKIGVLPCLDRKEK